MNVRHSFFVSAFFAAVLFLGTSCSTNQPFGHLEDETQNKDLVDTFNLSQFEKFKVGTPLPGSKSASATQVIVTAKAPLPEKAPVPVSGKKGKKSKKEVKEEIKPVETALDQFPKDYPELLKGYDPKYKKYWESFRPIMNKGEEFVFKASYLGITAGYMKMTTVEDAVVANREVYHVSGHLTSAEYYRMIYSVDDRIDTYIDKKTFTPMKYSLIQRESKQSVDDLQIFDRDNYQSHFWYKRIKKDAMKDEQKTDFIPRLFQDSFSALHFVRGLPLKVGSYFEFPVYTRAKIWIIKLWVEEEEDISVAGTDYKTFRIRAQTHFPGVLKANDDIYFWFTSTPERLPVKFKAKVKIGSIAGELVKYTAGH